MLARSVCFALEKAGSAVWEWEDGAGASEGSPGHGLDPRFIVVDGATEAYDALRWVAQLVTSFVGVTGQPHAPPALTPDAMRGWFDRMQQRWTAEAPTQFTNIIEEWKYRQDGSFATLLGCELTGLTGPTPRWNAVALGDTVLFHVRNNQLITHFPALRVDDFGVAPAGVHTKSEGIAQMMSDLEIGRGELRLGDQLFIATDAFAHWVLQRLQRDDQQLWRVLSELDHDATFAALVADVRAAGQMRNDDVTLLRVRLVAAEPDY